jgi:hypothetical protein
VRGKSPVQAALPVSEDKELLSLEIALLGLKTGPLEGMLL